MAETLLFQGVAVNPANGLRLRLGHNVETLGAGKTMTPQDAQVQLLDPDSGTRIVTMPDVDASQGAFFVFRNTGAGTLSITHVASSLDEDLDANRVGMYACDGSTWASALGVVTWA